MKTYTIETAYLTLVDAQIEALKYTDGQLALEATAPQHDPEEESPTVSEVLTTNLIGYGYLAEPGHAYIKDYDLYVGLPSALAKVGAVKIVNRHNFPFGRYAYVQSLIPRNAA